MRNIIIILLLLISISCFSQGKYKSYKPLYYKIDSLKVVKILNFEILQNIDSDFILSFLKYRLIGSKNEQFIPFDTLDYWSYKTDIRPYYSSKYSDLLVLWIIYNEFASEIKLYYINENNIYKAGELPILSTCKNCDEISYPPDKIQVNGNKELIQISFLEPVMLEQKGDIESIYLPGKIEYIFDKTTKTLKMHLP